MIEQEELPAPPRDEALRRKEEALWLFQRLAPDCAVDNLSFAISTSAALDPARLAVAVGELARRHPALRTVFPARDGAALRRVLDPDAVVPPVVHLDVPADRLAGTLTALSQQPFDLLTDLPFRVARVTVRGGPTVLCLVAHHIAFDARSAGIALPELATIYTELAGTAAATGIGHREPAAEDPGSPPSAQSLRYWTERLAGIDPLAQPLDRARPEPPAPTFAGGRLEQQLGSASRVALDALRSRLRVTDNMVLLAVYLLLMARHGAGPDLVIAVPADARGRGHERRVGFHVNTLPLRVTVRPDATFRQLAGEVRTQLVAGLAHADVSFESLLGELGLETMSWRAPLFRHMFNFLPASTIVAPGPLPDSAWVTVETGLSRYDLQFLVLRWPGRIALQVVYGTEIHDEAYVRALLDRFEILLRAAAADPDRPVAELDMWHPDERTLVARVNRLPERPAPDRPVPRLIAEWMRARPGGTALIEPDGRHLDYRWLGWRAAAIRERLAAVGVGRGDVVALALARGGDLAAAVLAGWSLGAAYLPVDPAQPPRRLREQLDVASARAVITGADMAPEGTSGRPVLRLERAGPAVRIAGPPLPDALDGAVGDDPAYIIFTSGSTGQPKAVEITHANLANLIGFFARHLAVTARDRVLWLTSFGFDISALELFLPLCHGGGAVVAPDAAQVRPAVLLDLITRHDPAIVQTTPTIWRLVAASLRRELDGRTVLCGGEPLSAALAERLLRAGCRLFNVYGPTETTIWSTVAEVRSGQPDPIGVGGPISLTTLRVVDPAGRPVPPGVVGELCIGGAGVARGYRGRPDLTAERFRDDPVFGRHYRTGDRATWRRDGTIELLGRADRQVKLRGRRLELGEIEAALERHPAVAAAAVVISGDPQHDGRLVGYLQPVPGPATVDPDLPAEVRRFAGTVLPAYLVPAALTVLDALPRNASGKLDYRALPAVPVDDGSGPATGAAQPDQDADPLVATLIEIWAELLDRRDVGAHSNFFASGGHSLLAAVLAARICERTGTEVSLPDVFTAPTPGELARLLRDATGALAQAPTVDREDTDERSVE
jgi:amino acid adenylation domain-containing protein